MTAPCVLFFGDDVVAGVGDAGHHGLVGRLLSAASETGIELVAYNLGVVGDTTLDVARRWRKESSPRVAGQEAWQPVFSMGGNDPDRVDVTTSVQSMQKIVARTRELGLRPLVVGPPPRGRHGRRAAIVDLSRRFADTCARHGVEYCETAVTLFDSTVWRAGSDRRDGPPCAEAYDELAGVIREDWLAWLARRSR
jgi:acyl-CoA thioesterase I